MSNDPTKIIAGTPAVVVPIQAGIAQSSQPVRSSYGQIFKSAAFTGGASVVNIALGVVRAKVMAVLLGPSGIGLLGLYMTINRLALTLAGMGIGNSGVRQIAEAVGSKDEECIARTIRTLRRSALVLGMGGALLLVGLSSPLSKLTFKDDVHTFAIAGLGITVLLGTVSAGQSALIQGFRRMSDLARLTILGAMAGTLFGLPLIWWLGNRGIVPSMIVLSATGLVCSWWFARRVTIMPVCLTWRESVHEARSLLGLGLAFMASSLMIALVAYLTRLLIVRQLGLAAAGYYTAAYTLAGVYAGFILQAMGADFYPRITAVSQDHPAVNRLVNEQTEIALLLAIPGILGTLTLAPWVIRVFYAGTFDPAIAVLQWQVLGTLGRIITWPIGFIILAKGKGKIFLLSESLCCLVNIGLVWLFIAPFGVTGAGMAFAAEYVFATPFIFYLTARMTGFRWSKLNLKLLAWMLPLVAAVFVATYRLPYSQSLPLGLVVTLITSYICVRKLIRCVPSHHLGKLGVFARLAR